MPASAPVVASWFAAAIAFPPATQPAGKIVRFAEGVVIDWGRPQVEIDAEVVLREGLLELLACSRGTKEHESILRIRARPLHVYQALGMLGLPDGQPSRYDEATRTVSPPRGTPVDVMLRLRRDGREVTEDAAAWLKPFAPGAKLPAARWYFVGAAPAPGERIGADIYGTVATLMPFGTSLVLFARSGTVKPPSSQPAERGIVPDDSEYINAPEDWALVPDPQRVPPVGTPVTLIIRVSPGGLSIRVDRFGRYWLDGREVALSELAETARRADAGAVAVIEISRYGVASDAEAAAAALRRGGVGDASIEIRPRDDGEFAENDVAAAVELLAQWPAGGAPLWQELADDLARLNEDLGRRREEVEQLAAAIREALSRRASTRPAP